MKKIVNGVTYNTETSTRLAEAEWEQDGNQMIETLFQTRGGAFFLDLEVTSREWNEHERDYDERITRTFTPVSPEGAHKWMMEGEVEIFHNPFDDPPEAAAEAEPASTIYIRVPASLKQRVDDAAKDAKTSGNVWAMRCVEKCLSQADIGSMKELVYIWNIASAAQLHGKGLDWDKAKCVAALSDIANYAERLAERLFGEDVLPTASKGPDAELGHILKEFAPYSG